MKKIIAFILVIVLCFGVLPGAFAANIGKTTEGLRKGKIVFHVDDDITYYKQQLVDILDESLALFTSPAYYCEAVWNEAQRLYTQEAERIYAASQEEELVKDSYLGPVVNDTTKEVYETITVLSQLDLTLAHSEADLAGLKEKLKEHINTSCEQVHPQSNYTDYYFARVSALQERALEEVENADGFCAFAKAKSKWEYFFNDTLTDPDFTVGGGLYESDVPTKEAMAYLVEVLALDLSAIAENEVNKGKSEEEVYTDDVILLINDFSEKAESCQINGEIYALYNESEQKLLKLLDIEDDANKVLLNNADRKKLKKEVDKIYYSYEQKNYSEENWWKLEERRNLAWDTIEGAKYREELGETFLAKVKQDMEDILPFEKELKQAQEDAVQTLRGYLGDKRFEQSKVKKLVKEGTAKIRAAKSPNQVYTLCDTYAAKLEKTIKTFKIAVSKSGKGTVSKTATVKYGKNFSVKITPGAGYKIKSVIVDGKKVKLTNTYTFKKVTKAHTIKVIFGK